MWKDKDCTCGDPEIKEHRCPYSDDIYDEYLLPDDEVDLCKCCSSCEHNCAMDI